MNYVDNYFVFLISGIILNITPGSDTIYILSRSIAQGRKAGILSVLGISSGSIIHTCLVAFGLSLILSKSVIVFNIVKYLGAGYLVYIGIRIIINDEMSFDKDVSNPVDVKPNRIYWQGMMTNLFNPKVALFFMSFLPQFIKPGTGNNPFPFLLLGATFITTGTIWCMVLAFAASYISKKLRENKRISFTLQKLCGIVFLGLAIKLVV